MKKLSILIFALSELYPCVVYASSNDEIRSIVKPCIDKIVSSVEGSGDGFTDDDLIKCASDLTRQNNKISISKAIAIEAFMLVKPISHLMILVSIVKEHTQVIVKLLEHKLQLKLMRLTST